MSQIKKILLITTGGTIASSKSDSGTGSQVSNEKKGDTFLSVLDPLKKYIIDEWGIELILKHDDYVNVDSSNISSEHWVGLVNIIEEKYDEFDAFVITHGTNTLSYTSSALSFALGNIGKPIILTGSQVPFGLPGSDALMNLENSIRIAAWEHHKIFGVLTVFGSHIITGVKVKKKTEFDYDAFETFKTNSIGKIGRDVHINEELLEQHRKFLTPVAQVKKRLNIKNGFDMSIASFTEFPSMSIDFLKEAIENKEIKGIILRSFGAGDPNENLFDFFRYLRSNNIPVIITTQAPNGFANMAVNEPGKKLIDEDLAIPAFDMSIETITIKLSWLLAQKHSFESLKVNMLKNLKGELTDIKDFS